MLSDFDMGGREGDPVYDDSRYDPTRLTLPYRFATTAFAQNPGVQTEGAIFFAVNPSLQMFTVLFEHCDGVKDRPFPRAQLMVLS
eukprot:2131533-Rhodomonas_salina.1